MIRRLVWLMLLVLPVAPVAAQPVPDRNCTDDRDGRSSRSGADPYGFRTGTSRDADGARRSGSVEVAHLALS